MKCFKSDVKQDLFFFYKLENKKRKTLLLITKSVSKNSRMSNERVRSSGPLCVSVWQQLCGVCGAILVASQVSSCLVTPSATAALGSFRHALPFEVCVDAAGVWEVLKICVCTHRTGETDED